MTLTQHAERELKLAGLFDKDSDYHGSLGKEVFSRKAGFSEAIR